MRLHGVHLSLVAALAALTACGPTTEEVVAGPQGDPASAQQALSTMNCGVLAPGAVLGRGQQITSCNGRLRLTHQTDGNVVLYDQVGWTWQTGTSGRSDTTGLAMQTDGNLVLYASTGAIWFSRTAGHNNARLVLQDDGNLVIYNTAGQAVWSTGTFFRIDLLSYMLNTSSPLRDSTYGDMQQTRTSGNKFWYLKNPSNGRRWERYAYDSSRIWLERDTTLPSGEGLGEGYDNSPYNSFWMPRIWSPVSWAPGRITTFSATHKYFNFLTGTTCQYNPTVGRWTNGVHQFRYLGPINMGGSVGTVDVAIIDRYHDRACSGCQYNPTTAERYWFARGRGWVRWEYWADRTTDPYWNSGNLNDMLYNVRPATAPNTTTSKRRTFISTTSAITFQDVCTALVP